VRVDGWARWAVLVLWVAVLVGIVLVVTTAKASYLLDLEVYRAGGTAWVRGLPLYTPDFPWDIAGPKLPFTYPPVAAVVFAGVAAVPLVWSELLLTVVGFVALTAVLVTVARGWFARPVLVGMAATVAAMAFEPVRCTFAFGQINLVLMALVALDCLAVRDRRVRGLMVGVAAAIKLTPAVFVVYFLVRRQWRAAGNAFAAFVVMGLLGFAFAPRDSSAYWFHAVFDPTRIGGLEIIRNQSLRGVISRLELPAQSVLWALSVVVVLGLAVVAARRAVRAGEDGLALVSIALAGLLISPLSWTHHWVWAAPALLLLAAHARTTGQRLLVGAAAAVFAGGPFLPDPEAPMQLVLGTSYVVAGLALLIALVMRRPVTPTEEIRHTPSVPDHLDPTPASHH
jgi:alpha-1,2-mannosyltransferase